MFELLDAADPEPLVAVVCAVVCTAAGGPQVVLVGGRIPAVPLSAGEGPAAAAAALVARLTGVACRSAPGEPGWLAVDRVLAVRAAPDQTVAGVRAVALVYGAAVPEAFPLPAAGAAWAPLAALLDAPETLAVVAEVARSL